MFGDTMKDNDEYSGFKRNPNAVALQMHCELLLHEPIQDGRPQFLSAASGLVCAEKNFYVVADDELHLGIFPIDLNQPGHAFRLFDGELPLKPKPRKKQKPDFEVLTYLPANADRPTAMLMVLGSGSRDNRTQGLLLPLNRQGELSVDTTPLQFDVSALYRELEREFDIVNIEGATVRGNELLLFQRGNKKAGTNAIVSLRLDACINAMLNGEVEAKLIDTLQLIELGSHDGVALGFTDAIAFNGTRGVPNDHLLALAVAEATDDPYIDGEASASYVCHFDSQNRLQTMTPLLAPAKTEGIALWPAHTTQEPVIAFVTDADDASIPAALLTAPLSAFI